MSVSRDVLKMILSQRHVDFAGWLCGFSLMPAPEKIDPLRATQAASRK
jgi:hypothetical protein